MSSDATVNFSQTIAVRCDDPEALVRHLATWDEEQAQADVMGYMGVHLLADRETPGRYLIVAEFASVDPDVSAAEEAARNNDRPETQAWDQRLRAIIDGEPEFHDWDELYRTG